MSQFALRSFSQTIFTRKSWSDPSRVPAPGSRIEFYRQGATIKTGLTIGSGATVGVSVYDPGALSASDTVRVGASGPTLTVASVTLATNTVTLTNGTGPSVVLAQGQRLTLISNRPTVYSDPFGSVPVPGVSYLLADDNGRVSAYVAERLFDYLVIEPATVGTSMATLTASASALSWTHQLAESSGIVLVSVAWLESAGEETLTGVTLDGAPMQLVATGSRLDVFSLDTSQTAPGPKTIQVTWSGSNPKGAVAGAVAFRGDGATTPLGSVTNTSGSSTSASGSLTTQGSPRTVFSAISVAPGTNVVSLSPGSQMTPQWNSSAGVGGLATLTQGAASIMPSSAPTTAPTWSIGPPGKLWTMISVEVLTSTLTLVVDALGGTMPSPSWLNARDYPTIQAAIDALPAAGGMVFIPEGVYTITSTIVIPPGKRVRLMGAGRERTIIKSASTSLDMVWIKSNDSGLEDLTLQGPYQASSAETQGRGIVIGQLSADNPTDIVRRATIIDCLVRGTASWALYLIGLDDAGAVADLSLSIFGTFERTTFQENMAFGLVKINHGNTTQYFRNCGFVQIVGYALRAEYGYQVQLDQCTFEASDDTKPYVEINWCDSTAISRCWFEHRGGFIAPHDSNTQRFIATKNDSQSVLIDSCEFTRHAAGVGGSSSAGRNPYAIELGDSAGGVVRGAVISGCHFTVPGIVLGSDHITIRNNSECVVVGGRIADGDPGYLPKIPQIDDSGSIRTGALGWAMRLRIPGITTAERMSPPGHWPAFQLGDVVRDAEDGKLYAKVAGSWQALW